MKKYKQTSIGLLWCALSVYSAPEAARAVDGTVRKIDTASKTIIVDTAEGTTDTFRYLDRTAVHGTAKAGRTTEEGLHGLKEGDKVAIHYTTEGTEKTAREVDRVGEGGLHAMEGTVSHFDRGAKTMAIKTAEGGEETFTLSDVAVKGSGSEIAEGANKSTKVVVYYADKGADKVAHFVKKII